ncbi:hypothetical protein DL767_000584 [Monosporascus sp. MG133]|nr:hypothetical protein DL767_000584 [Monosporascus sp. MG133]
MPRLGRRNAECQYSYMAKLGKPKGSRNKRTLEKLASAASGPSARKDVSGSGSVAPQPQSIVTSPHGVQLQPHATWVGLDLDFSANTDSLPGTGPLHPGFSSLNRVSTATDENESAAHVEEQFAMDFFADSTDADWERLITGTGAERQPRPGPTHGGLDHVHPEVGGEPKSSSQQKSQVDEEGNQKGQSCTFNCFRRLTNRLGNLNTMERQPNIICLEVTLSNADIVMGCAQRVLGCYSCRLDSKVLLLLMTVLQTVLNWVRVEYTSSQQRKCARDLPAIFFGSWKVPEADGHLIKGLLTRRILATCESVVKVLRLRLDEIALDASRENMTYQLMDAESLQHTLQRLASSLKQLMELIKALSQDREMHNMDE